MDLLASKRCWKLLHLFSILRRIMKKSIIKIIVLFLIALIPFICFTIIVEAQKNPFEQTYLASINDHYDNLKETEGKKIVFVGNSSLAFGLRSDLLENDLGNDYSVVNFGLYATLGTKLMMDLSKNCIKEGDIIILSPEVSEQTYSLYFNPQATLEAFDGFSPLFHKIAFSDRISLFYNYYKFASKKISYNKAGGVTSSNDIYSRASFNEYGDICVNRKNNIMNNGYDNNMPITVNTSILNDEFLDYVNKYVSFANKKGAHVYFNYSPLNRASIISSKVARAEFEKTLEERLDCPLLGTIEDYLIDERYFYDTNYHLNSTGAVYFTRLLSLNIKSIDQESPSSDIPILKPPALDDSTVVIDPNDKNVAFKDYDGRANIDFLDIFNYKLVGSTYSIVSVKPEYINIEEVILPSVYNGKNITTVSKNAFYGCSNLKKIHIGITYRSLEAEAFAGIPSLEGIYLYQTEGNKIIPPADGLLNGANSSVKLYIPQGANYHTGYIWSNYESRLEYFVVGGAQ